MTAWQYGRLVRTLVATHQGGPTVAPQHHWEERWYGPDGAASDPLPAEHGMAELNRAGAEGWELVSASEDRQTYEDGKSLVIEIRYTFKRPLAP
jgi:hypothetical protein